MSWRQQYEAVITSERWRLLKQAVVADRGGCERCYLITDQLELHHKHYRTLGRETENDVELLCEACHRQADEQRAMAGRHRLHSARLNGWARRKYGDDWDSYRDPDAVAEEFEAWLERQS